jgi:hypothetical protein
MALEADRVAQVLARAVSRLRGREERLVLAPGSSGGARPLARLGAVGPACPPGVPFRERAGLAPSPDPLGGGGGGEGGLPGPGGSSAGHGARALGRGPRPVARSAGTASRSAPGEARRPPQGGHRAPADTLGRPVRRSGPVSFPSRKPAAGAGEGLPRGEAEGGGTTLVALRVDLPLSPEKGSRWSGPCA